MKLLNVKGTTDFLPQEQLIRNKITKTLTSVFETYGYLPLDTSTLCYFDLLSSKYAGGAEILKEVYKLNDQGNRKLGLRYDLTVPFAKVIAMNKELTLPFRRYEIGKVFRDGPVKLGRVREFYQCDVDVCGIEGSLIEAEMMSLAITCYQKLGIDIYIEWNNRKLLSGLIIESGIAEKYVTQTILSVDKLAKIGESGVIKELEELNIEKSSLNQLFNYFQMDIKKLKNIFSNTTNETLRTGIEEALELTNLINTLGLTECRFTPYLARGLEIYTGTVWEVFDKEQRLTCSIGAGGRYDKIITNFIDDGNSYPALGMTFGLVPIYEILSQSKTSSPSPYDLYLIPLDTELESLKLANQLRSQGIKVIVEMNKKKVKKALDYANKNHIPFVIILGENELATQKVQVKDMLNSTTIETDLENINDIYQIITAHK